MRGGVRTTHHLLLSSVGEDHIVVHAAVVALKGSHVGL